MNQRKEFEDNGYTVARGLFSEDEAAHYRDHFMRLRQTGSYPGDMAGVDADADDPLLRYPRMIHMHRWDRESREWMLSDRIAGTVERLVDQPALAIQTMLYFKPSGSRGQALHQDQHFVRVHPGVCVAAWMALDVCDEENGCLQVVPDSHRLELLCVEKADTSTSFTDVGISIPDDVESAPVRMNPGDVLFFHGLLIHGSLPNLSETRFRRSLIAHFVSGDATRVADYYHPLVARNGDEVFLDDSPGGGPCGTWVSRESLTFDTERK